MNDLRDFDRAMQLAGIMNQLAQTVFQLTGEQLQNITVDAPHPGFATYDHHPTTFRRMWRWGTFSGVVVWSFD